MDLLPPVVTGITQTPSGDPATQPVDFFQITFNEDLAAATVNVSNPLVGYHNGRFYTVTPDTMTWTEAEAYAQSLDAGAHTWPPSTTPRRRPTCSSGTPTTAPGSA